MKYWITHPALPATHDQEIEAAALPNWARSGWLVREDQAAPPVDGTPADPRPPVDDTDTATETPAVKVGKTRQKGEV